MHVSVTSHTTSLRNHPAIPRRTVHAYAVVLSPGWLAVDYLGMAGILIRALIACVLAGTVLAPTALAVARPDSDAPPGAPATWLPAEEWVLGRWLPFDEARLNAVLRVETKDIAAYVDSKGSLEDLARSKGVRTRGLAQRLLRTRRRHLSQEEWAVMLDRTHRVLDQAHLAEHLLFHGFHMMGIGYELMGVTRATFDRLYWDEHWSFREIAASGGVGPKKLRNRVLRVAARNGRRGVALKAMSRAQNAVLRRRGSAAYADGWMTYRTGRRKKMATARVASSRGLCDLAVHGAR